MVNTEKEMKIKIKGIRLLSRQEFFKHADSIPPVGNSVCWWLADTTGDDVGYVEVGYVEGDYTEENMFCLRDEAGLHLRVALDVVAKGADIGKEFTYCGYVFTLLGEGLAISNNVLGSCKYYDQEIIPYLNLDEEEEKELASTIPAEIADHFGGGVPICI